MKKFVFSLAKVLDFRQQTLDVKKNELAALQAQLREVEAKIESLNRAFAESNQKMVEEMKAGLSVLEIGNYKFYFHSIDMEIKQCLKHKCGLEEAISEKKAGILAINSEISGLEKLKDKQLQEYWKTARKCEELAVEEFVSRSRCATS
ncbi:MAG: flagellar export protein FliJ [Clostridiales bacterium]|jgi:flagellar export protein FliJ|nr:flagellar export protein FliJ [Clostridiales bacterium]